MIVTISMEEEPVAEWDSGYLLWVEQDGDEWVVKGACIDDDGRGRIVQSARHVTRNAAVKAWAIAVGSQLSVDVEKD